MQILPLLEEGQYYHIYNRGNNREDIFIEEKNYKYFLTLYKKYILPIADTFAYCLMKNRFHLVVRIKEHPKENFQGLGDLEGLDATNQFSKLFNAYAKAINKAYDRTGGLFQKRFGRKEITGERYLCRLIHYVHFNPQKHGFVADYRDYPYSSYQLLLSTDSTMVLREEVLEWFGGKQYFQEFHDNVAEEKEISAYIEGD